MDEDTCSICEGEVKAEIDGKVHFKGLQSLIAKSKSRGDNKWINWQNVTEEKHILVHESCRKRYRSLSDNPPKKKPKTDSTAPAETTGNLEDIPAKPFDYKNLCILCGTDLDEKNKTTRIVNVNADQETILKWSNSVNDEKALEVARRINFIKYTNIEAKYHAKCRATIKSYDYISQTDPENVEKVFNLVTEHIEKSGDYRFEFVKLKKLMQESKTIVLSEHVLSKKLQEKYGTDILIVRRVSKRLVYFYKTRTFFESCHEWLADPHLLTDFNKNILLTLSADIIKRDVTNQNYEFKKYPPGNMFLRSVGKIIPKSLKTFLDRLLFVDNDDTNKVKRDSIAHAIISSVSPRNFLSTLQLAVGTYVLRKTGSKLIVNLLNKLGVSATYHNVQMYEASTIKNPLEIKKDQAYVQCIFDNTDHNVSTLTGHETFHCLGGIAVFTPKDAISYEGETIKCSTRPTSEELANAETIPIVPFTGGDPKKLEELEFLDTDKLKFERDPNRIPPPYVAYLLGKANLVPGTPLWKGFMEYAYRNVTYSMSHIECLPFVNGQPHDLTIIHSALLYALKKADECKQHTVFVTFDLPLYVKARTLVAQSDNPEFKRIIVRLGGFHLCMSYLGSIGYLMDESGLNELWATVYAGESVKKMMTGHAFSRAVRAHILTFTALGIIICKRIGSVSEETKNYMEKLFADWKQDASATASDYNENVFVSNSTDRFINELIELESKGGTPKMWIQYMTQVIILLRFIESERLGMWNLNLQSMEQMLPYLHAAGHWAYVKALQLFLQDMADLRNKMPVEKEFDLYTNKGFFTIRRSNKPFAGVWSDMTIEQTLNRFFGTDLKHGRGVTPSVVARYLLGMPAAFQVMESLEDYCDLMSANSEQHVDTATGRIKTDDDHIKSFVYWFEQHKPFQDRAGLTSLSTGIIGASNINCNMAYEKGREGMKSMLGKNWTNVKLSAATSKVNNFASARKGIHINEEHHTIDTNQLFHRIAVFFHGNEEKTKDALKYELAPFPPCLFNDDGYMRKPNKADLFKIFTPRSHTGLNFKDFCNVIDGGWLLNRISWPHGKTYKQICEIAVHYVKNKFGTDAKVVFDGYTNESTSSVKSYERFRRNEKNVAPDVDIKAEALININKKNFLKNVANKCKLVDLLANHFNEEGIETIIAPDDADAYIVRKAIEVDKQVEKSVAVIGSDVDLLILLTGLTADTCNLFYFKIPSSLKNIQLFSTSDNAIYRSFILFAHAFAGCDTTSALFNQGKKTIVSLLKNKTDLQKSISIFYDKNKTIDELYPIAQKVIRRLYSEKDDNTSIAELRYQTYKALILGGTKESPLSFIPPTDSALRLHTKRVYFQIQSWLENNQISPLDWGWQATNVMLIPKMLEDGTAIAPDSILKNIFCGCKGDCSSARCSCRKAGVKCNQFCKNCNGQTCRNNSIEPLNIDEEIDEYDNNLDNDNYSFEDSGESNENIDEESEEFEENMDIEEVEE